MAITVYGGLKKMATKWGFTVHKLPCMYVYMYVLSMHSYIYLPVLLTFISMSDDLPI